MHNQKTRVISFRCPEDLFLEIDNLCEHNRVDRSTYIVQALLGLFDGLAAQGVGTLRPELKPSALKDEA